MSKYKNMKCQAFDVYAYRTKRLNKWQKDYMIASAYGVWVYAGRVVARSPWEASRLARFIDKDGTDQRVPARFRNFKLRSQPSFEESTKP